MDDAPALSRERRIEKELSEPFCYFLVPSDVIGFMDCPEGTQVTWDGAFNTGFGEFDLLVGDPPMPIQKRVKTLHEGHLPIIEYAIEDKDLRYEVQAFAVPLDFDPRSNLVNFIRVRISNSGKHVRRALLKAVFGDRHGDARHDLGCQEWYRNRFMDWNRFSKTPEDTVAEGMAYRCDHLVFVAPVEESRNPFPHERGPAVSYAFDIETGQSRDIIFKVPYVPIDRNRLDQIAAVSSADYKDYLQRTVQFWKDVIDQAMTIDVADTKVRDTSRISLLYDLIARDITEDGSGFVQKVNEFQYDSFYPRDTAYILRTYDMFGLTKVAGETLGPFLQLGQDGRVERIRRLMPDDWGQSLWAIGSHYRTTLDGKFALRMLPAIRDHVALFESECKGDELGLWPVAGPYDNEAINGHYTGHSFWALLGLREAAAVARGALNGVEADRYMAIHDAYRARFLDRLTWICNQTGGYISPGIDDPAAGYDWANASGGVYPFGVLPPDHPWVAATVSLIRDYKYREGIMTYGPNAFAIMRKQQRNEPADPGWLHHYETFYVTETLLARDEQRKVIEDLYAVLAHTGSTHSGFEFTIRPWSDRDPKGNRPPHGWFAARFNSLLRNMLIREEEYKLHIASALAPNWTKPGEVIRVSNASTYFGRVSFEMRFEEGGVKTALDARWTKAPRDIVVHLPWFVKPVSASVDGKPIALGDHRISIPATSKSIDVRWICDSWPELSYERAVASFLDKYHHRRAQDDYSFLFPTPRPPAATVLQRQFVDRTSLTLFVPGGRGKIHYTTDGSPVDATCAIYDSPINTDRSMRLNARTIWEDGQESRQVSFELTKAVPRPASEVVARQPGLRYRYVEGIGQKLSDFTFADRGAAGITETVELEKIPHREDNFALELSGYLRIPKTGVYTFFLESDDGSDLRIEDTLVINNDGLHSRQELTGEMALAAGDHPITVRFFERGGVAWLRLRMAGADGVARTLGQGDFFH
jgi:hypothetical protein